MSIQGGDPSPKRTELNLGGLNPLPQKEVKAPVNPEDKNKMPMPNLDDKPMKIAKDTATLTGKLAARATSWAVKRAGDKGAVIATGVAGTIGLCLGLVCFYTSNSAEKAAGITNTWKDRGAAFGNKYMRGPCASAGLWIKQKAGIDTPQSMENCKAYIEKDAV